MKEYWFVIYPHCFLWVKSEEGLIYNTENHAKISFSNTGTLSHVVGKLSAMENLYCIRLTEKELENQDVAEWIQEIITKGCGELVEDNGINQRPLSLSPILKVQDEADYYRWEHNQGIDGNIMENLHRIVFHLNGSNYGNNLYARQTFYPTNSDCRLQAKDILDFAINARVSPFFSEISLVGNPFSFDGFDKLTEELLKISPVSLYCTYQDISDSSEQIKKLAQKVKLNIIVTNQTTVEIYPQEATITYIVTSEEEYNKVLECNRKNINIIPLYNGNNLHFFEKFLYIDKESIQDIALDKRDIFIHQKINIQNFGKLTVMPDGKVYANINHRPIGNINDSLHSIVYHEITEGNSWLQIRNEKPCCECIYQWLCPTPSSYEDVIRKTNLCTIKP